jgi:hypothetical protein
MLLDTVCSKVEKHHEYKLSMNLIIILSRQSLLQQVEHDWDFYNVRLVKGLI